MADASKPKTLTRFSVVETDRAYELHIEDDAGETIEFEARAEQLELIADTLDELLERDDTLEDDDIDEEEEDDDEEE